MEVAAVVVEEAVEPLAVVDEVVDEAEAEAGGWGWEVEEASLNAEVEAE